MKLKNKNLFEVIFPASPPAISGGEFGFAAAEPLAAVIRICITISIWMGTKKVRRSLTWFTSV
jgi:hypothetical protein